MPPSGYMLTKYILTKHSIKPSPPPTSSHPQKHALNQWRNQKFEIWGGVGGVWWKIF